MPLHAPTAPLDGQATKAPQSTRREDAIRALAQDKVWDLVVVGGGATGLGIALDAVTRGLSVVVLEAHDFAHGTSSRSTKLIHGGVRYVAQGRLGLVKEALQERAILLRNASHLVRPLPFVMPAYHWWEIPFYGAGLMAYDMLSGKASLGRARWLSATQTQAALPTVACQQLKGGIQYWDAQFDDARLAITIARTAAQYGALLVNYCPVTHLHYQQNAANSVQSVAGVECQDKETGLTYAVRSRCVINATGVWVDQLRQTDAQATSQTHIHNMVVPSQGAHIVVHSSFLPQGKALMVPKTRDGRVLFAIPWLGHVVIGTTETERQQPSHEPRPLQDEVDFILREIAQYLAQPPTQEDVLSMWAGLRPLVQSVPDEDGQTTAQGDLNPKQTAATSAISREHAIAFNPSGLVTVAGGKWTTYRAMAQDVLDQCVRKAYWTTPLKPCATDRLPLVGAPKSDLSSNTVLPMPSAEMAAYGLEAAAVQSLPGGQTWIAHGLSEAMVRFAVRNEYARTVEDVLSRRSRLLFLHAKNAIEAAPAVATILASEGVHDAAVDAFFALAQHYLRPESA